MFRALCIIIPATLCVAVPAGAAAPVLTVGTDTGTPGPVSCWSAGNCIVTAMESGDSTQNGTPAVSIVLIRHGAVAGRDVVRVGQDGDIDEIDSASCPSASVCFVSGLLGPANLLSASAAGGYIAPVVDGKLGRPVVFHQMDEIGAIRCRTDGVCVAVGAKAGLSARDSHAYVVTLQDGAVQQIHVLGAIFPTALSCDGSSCLAIGTRPVSPTGASVAIHNGVAGTVSTAPFAPFSVACETASRCLVAGATPAGISTPTVNYLATVHNGRYGAIHTTPDFVGDLACTTTTSCFGTEDEQLAGGIVAIHNGIAGPLQLVPKVFQFTDLACVRSRWCLAAGTLTPGTRDAYYAF